MQKQELIEKFIHNHQEVARYVDGLDDFEFTYTNNGKWTAGQQLEHILLTITPFPKILNAKEFIIEKFGNIHRKTWDYKTVLDNYAKTTLKSPEQFVPRGALTTNQKAEMVSEINKTLKQIKDAFENYSEEELDTLTVPHPLLGKLTIREMFYLMSYHPLHHQKQIVDMLTQQADSHYQ